MWLLALAAALPPEDTPDLARTARALPRREAFALGVGGWVADAAGTDLTGQRRSWRAGAGPRGTVLVATSLTCPLGQKLAPEVARVEDRATGVGFGFVHVALGGLDDAAALRGHVEAHGLAGLVLRDTDGALAAALDVQTTTEVFVVDERGTLRYRGAVNDQYGLGHALDAPRHTFLDDALRALIRGEDPGVLATTAPGCAVEPVTVASTDAADVTYSRDVARLVQRRCVECHRAGGVAPFALEDYDAVARRVTMLAAVVEEGVMPPWFAAHGDGPSPFANDRSLLPEERALLSRWIAAGKPRGDDADMPRPHAAMQAGWALGEPDAVYMLPAPFRVPAEGRVEYQYTAVPTRLTQDRWVRAIEVRPGTVEVVHHVLAYALPEEALEGGRLRRWDLLDERRGFFAAWAPGSSPVVYPEGHARALPAGTVLMFELHYTTNGRAVSDQSAIGVHFAPDGFIPQHVVRTAGIRNRGFEIPAGAARHVDVSTGVLTRGVRVLAYMPHMHLRGAAFRFERVPTDGDRETLLDVPRYDFNWQLRYELVTPLELPRGARIDVTATFDNSAGNPANPAPERAVRWGPETTDEMLIGFVDYVLAEEDLALPSDSPPFVVLEPRVVASLRALAETHGGALPRRAMPRGARRDFDALDLDRNGLLTPTELPLLPSPNRK